VEANEAYKVSVHLLKAEWRRTVTIWTGRSAGVRQDDIPGGVLLRGNGEGEQLEWYDYLTVGAARFLEFGRIWRGTYEEVQAKIEALAKSLSKFQRRGGRPSRQGCEGSKGRGQGLAMCWSGQGSGRKT